MSANYVFESFELIFLGVCHTGGQVQMCWMCKHFIINGVGTFVGYDLFTNS